MRRTVCWLFLSACVFSCVPHSAAQSTPPSPAPVAPTPRDYRGVQVHVDGVWMTPVPNAPFTATVQIVSHSKLPDGTDHTVMTINHVARSSSGRIRNERRRLVPTTFEGEPMLLEAHLYDPNTGQNIYFSPSTHVARQTILRAPPRTPAQARPPGQQPTPADIVVTDLGEKPLNGITLHGTRKVRTIPAERSGTGQAVLVTDDYWYSPELFVYLIIRHNDPRTGEQLVAVTDIQRAEPAAELMAVPQNYKLVDETPPEAVPPVTAK